MIFVHLPLMQRHCPLNNLSLRPSVGEEQNFLQHSKVGVAEPFEVKGGQNLCVPLV